MTEIEVISWNPVVVWSYDDKGGNSVCSICGKINTLLCETCRVNNTNVDETNKCLVSRGKCGHVFHEHCIKDILKIGSICPTCKTPWGFDVDNMDNNEDWKKMITERINIKHKSIEK